MSEITEVKTSLKKIVSTLEEIKSLTTDSIPNLISHPKKLLKMTEQYEEEKNNNLKTIDNNIDEINSLKNKITQNKRNIEKLEEDNDEKTKKRQELIEKIQKVQNELKETEDKVKVKKEELENRTQRYAELEKNVQEAMSIQEEFEEKMKNTQAQLQEEFDKLDKFAKTFETRIAAMKTLIKKKYISSPILKVIQALQKDTTLELKSIAISLDIKEDIIKKHLRKMLEENGPIEYNERAGTVLLKEEVDF
ncbi:MAG: hypothetical protein ACFFAN_00940 [Promethearchaeota archaeon]